MLCVVEMRNTLLMSFCALMCSDVMIYCMIFNMMLTSHDIMSSLSYRQMLTSLERDLCDITGFAAVSLQPNAGSQGEYAGNNTHWAH